MPAETRFKNQEPFFSEKLTVHAKKTAITLTSSLKRCEAYTDFCDLEKAVL